MTPNAAPATTKYALNTATPAEMTATVGTALRRLAPLMADEKRTVGFAFGAIVLTSATSLVSPVIIGRAVDVYMRQKDFRGVLTLAGILLAVYVVGLFAATMLKSCEIPTLTWV